MAYTNNLVVKAQQRLAKSKEILEKSKAANFENIRSGCYYLARCGIIVGPMLELSNGEFGEYDSKLTWTAHGWYHRANLYDTHPLDLMYELSSVKDEYLKMYNEAGLVPEKWPWCAVDYNGACWAYKVKPEFGPNRWGVGLVNFNFVRIGTTNKPDDASKTLINVME